MKREKVEEKIRALAERRAEAEERLRQSEERLAELEDEQSELQGRATLSRRALAELETYEARLNEELRLAAVEEARAAIDAAVRLREEAAEKAATAAQALRFAHERLQEARAGVAEAETALRQLDRAAPAPQPETTAFDDAWHSIAPLVEQELNTRLEMQIVAAAAESANHLDIETLPEHLQLLARARRHEILSQRRRAILKQRRRTEQS